MNRNIAKPFVATLSLLDVASDKTHKYKCFHGEDVQLTVNVVGEDNRRIDLSNTSVKIYFTLDKNVNEPVYRQDAGIMVDDLGVITVMLEKSYIRIGNNVLKIALYDEDQTVFLQPLIISCIDPLIGEVADLEIPDDINVRDELSDIRRIIGDLQDFDDDLGSEIVQARNEYGTVGERLDNFDSQLDNIKNATKQIYKSTIGVNMWFNMGSSDSYINEVLNDMERLKIKSLLLPCYNVITGNDVDGYSYTKNVSEEQITNVITKAREKGIEDIIIKLHRDGKKDTNSLKWIEMWQTVVNEYIQICKKNNITSLVFVNEQKNATANNIDKWIEIITSVKNNGLKAICSLADISEFNSSIINDLVDVIGINHYPKLTNKNEVVTQEEYNKRMFSNSLPLFKRVKKLYPNTTIWITEIGCTRNIDALYSPASWEFDTTSQSNDIQALFVDSVMSTFGCYDNQLFEKVYWWSTDEKTKVNTFTFFGNDKAENNYLKYLGGV